MKDINTKTYDLSVKNPNKNDEAILREPKEILREMFVLDKRRGIRFYIILENMKLLSISIENFRSIEKETITINKIDGGYTYALIGINESGKSSILKAISLKESLKGVSYPQDYNDSSKPISIIFEYSPNVDEIDTFKEMLAEKGLTDEALKKVSIKKVLIKVLFDAVASSVGKKDIEFVLANETIAGYSENGQAVVKNEESKEQASLNLNKYLKTNFSSFFFDRSHKVIFWVSESKYLITEPVNLDLFSKTPQTVSIPLYNCFGLAGITDIPSGNK